MTRKSSIYDYEACVHDLQLDRPNRELYLVGEEEAKGSGSAEPEPGVEYLLANRIIRNLRILTLAGNDPILIHMKTCGGFEEEGFAIYDAIRACPCWVTILSYTHARSMSSIILQAADRRVLMPTSCFMFHRGNIATDGEANAIRSYIEFAKYYEDRMLDIYAEQMKQSEQSVFQSWSMERIHKKLTEEMNKRTDVYLTAVDAVKWGLADAVFDGDWVGLCKN